MKSDFYGKTLPNSTPFSDRGIMGSSYDLQIIKLTVFYDPIHKFLKGFQALYSKNNRSQTLEGARNAIFIENLDKIEKSEFACSENDFFRSIGGSVSSKGLVESLIITSNTDVVFKVGEESPHCFRFSLNIAENEIPICLFGEYSIFIGMNFFFLFFSYEELMFK